MNLWNAILLLLFEEFWQSHWLVYLFEFLTIMQEKVGVCSCQYKMIFILRVSDIHEWKYFSTTKSNKTIKNNTEIIVFLLCLLIDFWSHFPNYKFSQWYPANHKVMYLGQEYLKIEIDKLRPNKVNTCTLLFLCVKEKILCLIAR